MAKNKRDIKDANPLEGIAANILSEIIKADMSMHVAQIEAWEWFAAHRPKGEFINDDIYEGFASNMFLSMNELKLQWYVKPLPLNLWMRFKLAFQGILFGMVRLDQKDFMLVMTTPSDPDGMRVEIVVNRYKNGTVKASYTTVDEMTDDLKKRI